MTKKNLVESEAPQITIWRCVACWVSKVTRVRAYAHAPAPPPHTHKYVILTAFPLQQCFRERASVLRYNTCIACPVMSSSHLRLDLTSGLAFSPVLLTGANQFLPYFPRLLSDVREIRTHRRSALVSFMKICREGRRNLHTSPFSSCEFHENLQGRPQESAHIAVQLLWVSWKSAGKVVGICTHRRSALVSFVKIFREGRRNLHTSPFKSCEFHENLQGRP
jgi:hypothetical protein